MQIVPSTFPALIVALGILLLGPQRGLWLYLAATPFGMAAALNLPAVGGMSILLADLALVAIFGSLLVRSNAAPAIFGTMRPFQPGFFLLLLLVWCAASAFLLPRLFEGQTEVFGMARVQGQIGILLKPLMPSSGNFSQLFRMILSVMSFVALATLFRLNPDPRPVVIAMAAAAVVHVLLGWADVLSFEAGMAQLLDPIRTANYALTANHKLAGIKRMIGGFPEASAFGYYTVGLFGFWLQYWLSTRQSRLAFWMMIALLIALLRSTSSSAYLALGAFMALAALLNLSTNDRISRRSACMLGVLAVALPILAAGLTVAYQTDPAISAYFDRLLFEKLDSDSGVERMSWNAQALTNFLETNMLGAGLGSVRASNWLIATLSNVGLIGATLFAAFLWTLAGAPARNEARGGDDQRAAVILALKMGCLALLCRAMVVKSTPNLELIFLSMAGLAAGLSRGATARASVSLSTLDRLGAAPG